MATTTTTWRPDWWKEETHGSTWERIKAAVQRDWEQTKRDLHLGGHEMNQGVGDTVKQAAGKEPLPASDKPNPPKVIGNWNDVEYPVGYGYGARTQYGAHHPTWGNDIENRLKSEWETAKDKTRRSWDEVKDHIRYGYDYKR